MAILRVDTIEPEGATTNLAVGETGGNIDVAGNDIRANVLQDSGGNAIFTSDGSGNLSGVNAGFGSDMSLLLTTTVSTPVQYLTFSSTYITSTYKEYWIKFYNIHPVSNAQDFRMEVSADNGTDLYNGVNIVSVYHLSTHDNSNSQDVLIQDTYGAKRNATGVQVLIRQQGNGTLSGGGKMSCCGDFHLYNPGGTTMKKMFWSRMHRGDDYAQDIWAEGTFNQVGAVNALRFGFASGNIDHGIAKLYGIK
tara:strand:+ start:535 stop:1284 length:750 start_codon:yes stop_codon:yes gene_type:complete